MGGIGKGVEGVGSLVFDLLCCGKATEVVEFMIAPDLRLEGPVSSAELELRQWESGMGGMGG